MAEHDAVVFNNHLGRDVTTYYQSRRDDEYYSLYYVEEYDWCFTSLVNFDNADSDSDLYADK